MRGTGGGRAGEAAASGKAEGRELRVPLGLDAAGRGVRAGEALRGERYLCPSCRSELVLREGERRIRHFSHRALPRRCDFVQETERHFWAKWRIAELVARGTPPRLRRACADCGRALVQPLPARIKAALVEYPLPTGHRADVALLDEDGALLAAIEVRETHAVDAEKAAALARADLPWAELDAAVVLADPGPLPPAWPLLVDRLRPLRCRRCRGGGEGGAAEPLLRPFGGRLRLEVPCPLADRPAHPLAACAACPHFFDAEPGGVLCTGGSPLRPFDRHGDPLAEAVYAQLLRVGEALAAHGYEESAAKANLFFLRGGPWIFFCDLRGSAHLPFWRLPAALFYWQAPEGQAEAWARAAWIESRRLAALPLRLPRGLLLGDEGPFARRLVDHFRERELALRRGSLHKH